MSLVVFFGSLMAVWENYYDEGKWDLGVLDFRDTGML
jgi:hypothetical protein